MQQCNYIVTSHSCHNTALCGLDCIMEIFGYTGRTLGYCQSLDWKQGKTEDSRDSLALWNRNSLQPTTENQPKSVSKAP